MDFTTQADTEADEFLRKNILKKYPRSNFLTEETAPKDYSIFKNTVNLWVIDPLDGTINFSRGNPNFAISIALVSKGIPELGVIYKPITKEIYWAQENIKYALLNDKPIYVSSTNNLRESVIACDWAWSLEKRLNVVKWLHNISPYVQTNKIYGKRSC